MSVMRGLQLSLESVVRVQDRVDQILMNLNEE